MRKLTFLIAFLATTIALSAQDIDSDSYYPLSIGQKKTLTWYNNKYQEVIKDTVNISGKRYTIISQIFSKNKVIDLFMRVSNDTVYFYNTKKKLEIPYFGIAPNVGEKIGNGVVLNREAKLKTPSGTLKELLKIEMNYPNGAKDIRYYKKGLGLVAVKNKKGLICYYIPD
ncbi:hypothetical protein KMW28_24230 [Flammeovirga yaeyamensis]|uniref:Uncharacterized protein n=1 Tax=Flammeovirga yaeyamensis TaxID=367791 RepID=A0AAX1NF47_9BACT|nr:hypothetical protein [Flammeovirga yaeyamensis]MBB3696509.1 hypothetical protein [Flammeovirga yaeyamensis]NMF33189.1 hypothetical protein [Flammeovirga yaeyamensis]QWG05531.1 hypothetical protein KMW28_24230 [Flammeovirga yaeyamensis]